MNFNRTGQNDDPKKNGIMDAQKRFAEALADKVKAIEQYRTTSNRSTEITLLTAKTRRMLIVLGTAGIILIIFIFWLDHNHRSRLNSTTSAATAEKIKGLNSKQKGNKYTPNR